MSTIKCPQCGMTNFATAISCRRCGYFFQEVEPGASPTNFGGDAAFTQPLGPENPPPFQQQYSQPNFQPNFQSPPNQRNYAPNYYQPVKLKSGLALTSMILGLIGCFVTSPIGLILAIVALVKSNRHPNEYGGKGFAIAGVVLNGLGLLFLPVVAAIAIPNLLAARRAANESGAISTIRTIAAAETTYMSTKLGKCGDLETLAATKLIDVSLVKGEKFGYLISIANLPYGGCEIMATPRKLSDGNRSFYYSTLDQTIRAGIKKGLPAGKDDAPLGSSTNSFETSENVDKELSEVPNERAAIASMRTLYSAQVTYIATAGQGTPGNLQELGKNSLISPTIADGVDGGYTFTFKKGSMNDWDYTATPNAPNARSFFIASEGILRGRMKGGQPAGKIDPPIE